MFTIVNVNFTYVYVKFCIFLVSGLHIQWYILHALQLQYSTATCELALRCFALLAWLGGFRILGGWLGGFRILLIIVWIQSWLVLQSHSKTVSRERKEEEIQQKSKYSCEKEENINREHKSSKSVIRKYSKKVLEIILSFRAQNCSLRSQLVSQMCIGSSATRRRSGSCQGAAGREERHLSGP